MAEQEVGFVTMGRTAGAEDARTIGVGMLGYAFMGKAHANAYRKITYMTWPPPLVPRLVAISGRTEEAVAEAARRYGFEGYVTDWRELVSNGDVELFDNSGPNNLHAEPTIAAAEAGKHVVCEKPLARTAGESYEVWQRVAATGVKHMCAFNYRFVPAVRLARELLEAGELGDIYHFRGRYLQEWGDIDDQVWRFERATAGSGALGDLGAHVIDLARYLIGEIEAVSGGTRTFKEGRDVDDAFEAVVEFENGAIGTVEASRFCPGRKNAFTWEINGSKGSIAFDLERLNELQVSLKGTKPGEGAQGFRQVLVSEADHPFWEHWWPHGHIIGWEHSFVHELHHLLTAVAEDTDVAPHGATFEDGYRAAEVCDAIVAVQREGPQGRGRVSLSGASNSSPPAWATSSSPRSWRTRSYCSRRRATRWVFRRSRSAAASPRLTPGIAGPLTAWRARSRAPFRGTGPSSARPAPARRWRLTTSRSSLESSRSRSGSSRPSWPRRGRPHPFGTTVARSPTTIPATCSESSGSRTSLEGCWNGPGLSSLRCLGRTCAVASAGRSQSASRRSPSQWPTTS